MNRYRMVVWWSEEDGLFLVEVPDLPGCMADGATYEDAVRNAQVMAAEWVDTARSLGRPIPEPVAARLALA